MNLLVTSAFLLDEIKFSNKFLIWRFHNTFETKLTSTLSKRCRSPIFYQPFLAVLFSINFITGCFKVLSSFVLEKLFKWQKETNFNLIPKSFIEFFCETFVSRRFVNFHFIQFMFYLLLVYLFRKEHIDRHSISEGFYLVDIAIPIVYKCRHFGKKSF